MDLLPKLERGGCLDPRGQGQWNTGFGVRKTRAQMLHFHLTGSVALSSSWQCVRLCLSFLICKTGILTSTSQGCCEKKTNVSTDSLQYPSCALP